MPYLFLLVSFSFFGLWTNNTSTGVRVKLTRSISSVEDCFDLTHEIISPNAVTERLIIKNAENQQTDKLIKFKNTIWNKIITSKDFEDFDDREYFRWLEIYKDSKNTLWNVNPVSIEQKIAVIEIINTKLVPLTIDEKQTITKEMEKLSAYKLRILQTHLRHFDLSSKLTRGDLEEFASDLMIILKGPPVSLMDYFTSNKTQRMNERLMRTIQEDMLLLGLKGIVNRIPERNSYTRLEKSKFLIQKFFQLKIWRYLVMPYDLPWIERVKVPEELLQRILIDGLKTHEQELIAHFKRQGMIDHYERFRIVYKPLAFSVGFYFYYEKFSDKLSGKITETQEEERKRLVNDFINLANQIIGQNGVEVKSADTIKDEHFKRLINSYKEKYKEDPTPEEYEEFHKKAYGPT